MDIKADKITSRYGNWAMISGFKLKTIRLMRKERNNNHNG